jgi:decaprenylphospho-beta-D-erythro-pentofuranosid-2-ulose 2-reductase
MSADVKMPATSASSKGDAATELRLPEQPLPLRSVREDTAPKDKEHAPKRILVLGATSGIAEACLRLWAARGDKLYLVARSEDRLHVVAADAHVRGASLVETAVANLDDLEQHPELLAHAVNALGGLDVAFVALGVLGEQAEGELRAEVAAQVLHTNFTAPVSLLTWLGNFMAQRHAGTLAVLTSVAGERGRKSNYIYGSSKAGLTVFVDGMRNRIDREGVRVMTIKPGPVRTAMTEHMKGNAKFANVDDVAAAIVKAVDRGTDVVYVPAIWRVIMCIIRAIPESIFKKLNL